MPVGIVTFLLGNWRTIAVVGLVVGIGIWITGLRVERDIARHQRDALQALVDKMKAAGKAQEERTKAAIDAAKKDKEQADHDYQDRISRLNNLAARTHDELHNAIARRSIVPTVPPAPGSSGSPAQQSANVVCFARDQLSASLTASLEEFAGQYGNLVQQGASAIAGFKSCAGWALEEAAKDGRK